MNMVNDFLSCIQHACLEWFLLIQYRKMFRQWVIKVLKTAVFIQNSAMKKAAKIRRRGWKKVIK